ncbi:MAG TPA: DNA recombination protein RmuC [Candidatus Saccharimonadales bacterium]|nr:DNA recombination protein RmuC [Candidatus Saccharimonadales bacterium]
MSPEFFVVIILLLIGFGIIIYFLNRKLSQLQNKQTDPLFLEFVKNMQNRMDSTTQMLQNNSMNMTQVLQQNARQLHERLDKAAEAMRDVNKEVGRMNEIGKNMQELQEFLKSPKLRGNIGEHVLTDLITQIFPKNSFHLQYQFHSGEKVDAAIKTDGGILPIDAKFPMENFQKMGRAQGEEEKLVSKREFIRDIKRHIDAISRKYILPNEGTMDFALMYIPSESVYYEVVNLEELLSYARDARVYFVSPSTLYAHLQTILLSFEGKKIETKSREVFKLLRALQIDYEKVNDSLDVLGKHLNNASGQYNNVTKGFYTLGQKLESTKHLEDVTEEKLLE